MGALPKAELQIRAHANQLKQALVGLLENAISAAAKSPAREVRVSFSTDAHQHLNIEILSTGGGALSDGSHSIFEPTVTTTTTNIKMRLWDCHWQES